MVNAAFTLDIPESVWIGALSRSYPDATFRVLSAFPETDTGYGLLEIESGSVGDVVAAIEADEAVRSVETVRRSEDRAVVQFETTQLPLLLTVQRARVPLEFPIELRDGRVELELTAPRERVSEFADQLRALGVSHSLDRIYREVEVDDLLTDHQRDLLVTAVEHGYYDTPRTITLTELAEELDAAPSTVSETLHRIEGSVLKEYAAERLDLDGE